MKYTSPAALYNQIANRGNFILVAGNCVLEDKQTALETASFIRHLVDNHNSLIFPIFKASFLKDNRESLEVYQGVRISYAVRVFQDIKDRYGLPILTDFAYQQDLTNDMVDVVDVLQLPAFLCMQSTLTVGLAKKGKPVNIKKGQFLAPNDIEHVINKIKAVGNTMIILTERGSSFGYHDLVVDPRSIHILRMFGFPVLIDAGHAVRKKEYIPSIAKAGIAAGATGLYIEVHPDPERAKSDVATQLNFEELEDLIAQVIPIWEANTGVIL